MVRKMMERNEQIKSSIFPQFIKRDSLKEPEPFFETIYSINLSEYYFARHSRNFHHNIQTKKDCYETHIAHQDEKWACIPYPGKLSFEVARIPKSCGVHAAAPRFILSPYIEIFLEGPYPPSEKSGAYPMGPSNNFVRVSRGEGEVNTFLLKCFHE